MNKTYLQKLAAAFCLLLFANCLFSQTGNPLSCLPPNSLNYTGTPVPLPTNTTTSTSYTGQTTYDYAPPQGWFSTTYSGPSNMYADKQGKPLFFIVAGHIYNNNGYLIDTLTDLLTYHNDPFTPYTASTPIQGWTENCVVPNPANCKQYFVFSSQVIFQTADTNLNPCSTNNLTSGYGYINNRPYYTLLDVSLPTPNAPGGQLGQNLYHTSTSTARSLYNTTALSYTASGCAPFTGDIHYAASKVYNKGGATPYRLLFVMNNAEIITFKITGTGSYPVQWINTYQLSTLSSNHVGNLRANVNPTELEIYSDSVNHKIKTAFGAPDDAGFNPNMNFLCTADFDTLGNYMSSSFNYYCVNKACATSFTSYFSFIKGIEFTSDGNYVYFNHQPNSSYPYTLERLQYGGSHTRLTIAVDSAFKNTQIEKGTDGNLYLVKIEATGGSLSKITNASGATPVLTNSVTSLSYYSQQNLIGNPGWPSGFLGSIFFLPDQIDQEVYGSQFNSPIACCLFYSNYDKISYYAGTTTTTWTNTATTQTWTANSGTITNNPIALSSNTTSTVTIGEELRIPAGYTVTINNMTIQFSPQARFIIEDGKASANGGMLFLKNCTLQVDTRCVNDLWPGMQIWGSPGVTTMSNASMGYVNMQNCQVQDAYIGVLQGYSGVWLSATTPDPGASSISAGLLSLNTTDSFPGGGGMFYNYNNTFLNCQRSNVAYTYTNTSNGLNVHRNTNYKITSALVNPSVSPTRFIDYYKYQTGIGINGCTFTDARSTPSYAMHGVHSYNSSYSMNQYGSVRAYISNMAYGIYAYNTGSSLATITVKQHSLRNNNVGIYLGRVNNADIESDTFKIRLIVATNTSGLYLDNSTGYKVQYNWFDRYNVSTSKSYGIVVNNSGPYVNYIFSNTFANIWKGSQPQYRNWTPAYPSTIRNAAGLLYVCNTFSPSTIFYADIFMPATGSSNNVGASCSGCDTAAIAVNQGTGNAGYPATGGNSFSHTSKDFWVESGKSYNSYYVYYCPAGTATCTSTSYYPNPLTNSLLLVSSYTNNVNCSSSPYSRTMYENPVTMAIEAAASYKEEYNGLLARYNNGNHSDSITSQMTAAFTNRQLALDDAIRILVRTSDNDSITWAKRLMKEKSLELPTRAQVETGLDIKDSAFAAEALNLIAQMEGQSNYVKLHTLLLSNLSKAPETFLTQSNIHMLQGFDKDSTDRLTYMKANHLLSLVGKSDYVPYIQDVTDTTYDNEQARKAHKNKGIGSLSSLSNHPNPFTDVTTIKANVVEKTANAYLLVTDVTGREIARYPVQTGDNSVEVNTANINYNVLFCTLVMDGVKVKTTKMLIVK